MANVNDAPVITSTAITTATQDVAYSYTLTASDTDGDTLVYSDQSAPALPAWISFNPTTHVLSGTPANADVGTINVVLRVTDGTVNVDQSFSITVANVNDAPVANAGIDQSVFVGNTVTLDGSGSSDADGDVLTYSWLITSKPLGSTASLSDSTVVTPSFVIDVPGVYVVQLIVNDGLVNSLADTLSISTINSAPVANAGADQSAFVGDTVTLDGSGSTDADGDTLTFSWSFASRPVGSIAILSNSTEVMPTFVADISGSYVVQLVVNDGLVNSLADTVSISTGNSVPVANAGAAQSVFVGNTVTLDGSGSIDVDGDALTYSWSLTSIPAGSAAILSSPGTINPSFVVDVAGSYVVQLIVNDGTVNSLTDTVSISTINSAPVADAGADQTSLLGNTVILDGSGSTDVDGDTLSYRWTLFTMPFGSTATMSDPTSINPRFVIDVPGSYVAQLIVSDGIVNSLTDTVNISTINSAPVANAGTDQSSIVGATITLNGSGSSDVDGDALTYSWSLTSKPAGSAATLSDPVAVTTNFVIDVPGDYVAQLIVNDGLVNSLADTVTISTSNTAPLADAGADQSAFVGNTVTLDASSSTDVDGDALTYSWSLTSIPAGSAATLSGPGAINPSFVIDVPGDYVAQLIVNDGLVDSAPVTVNISTRNTAPVASAGADQSTFVEHTATLDGSGSTDVDGDALTYSWSLTSKPASSTATLSDPGIINPSFVIDVPGDYVAQLIVNDGLVNSLADTVTISTSNTAPLADAGADQSAFVGNTVILDGSGSTDVDGDTLTYSWSLTSIPAGSTASLSGAGTINPSFVIDIPGSYVAQLIVTDGLVDSMPDTVTISTINSAPVANAGADQTALEGNTVILDGSGSSDADGDALTFSWSLTSVPPGSTASLSDPTAVSPNFVVDVPGTYMVQLIVNDGQLSSAPDVAVATWVVDPDTGGDLIVINNVDSDGGGGGGSVDLITLILFISLALYRRNLSIKRGGSYHVSR